MAWQENFLREGKSGGCAAIDTPLFFHPSNVLDPIGLILELTFVPLLRFYRRKQPQKRFTSVYHATNSYSSQNCSLGNKPFALKLKVYGSDNLLYQQKEIIEFVIDKGKPIWDKDCIKRRRDKIIQAAKEIWSLDSI